MRIKTSPTANTLSDDTGARFTSRLRPALVSVLITVVMLAVTFVYWQNEEREIANARKNLFAQAANQIAANIDRRLSNFELILRGVKGLYESTGHVSRAAFNTYVNTLQLDQTRPGLQGLGIALIVPHTEKDRHVTAIRQSGFPDYDIKPPGDRERYFPIILIEPYAGANLTAIGFDLSANPVTLPALQRACDEDSVAVTSRLKLVQDTTDSIPAVSMYVPIYAPGTKPTTAQERRAAIVGWAHAPFRVGDLIAGLSNLIDRDIDISIFEGDVISPDSRLYGAIPSQGSVPADSGLSVTQKLDVGGRQWTLLLRAKPEFDARLIGQSDHHGIALAGALISILLGWFAWLMATGRDRAVALARTMTRDLEAVRSDQEATLDAMPDILFELGLDGRYYNFRTSKLSHLAAPPETIVGSLIEDILPAEASAICLAALQEANATGLSTGRQIELPIGNELRWYELSVARKNDPKLDSPRFVMISRDITDRKNVEKQLRLNAEVFNSSRDAIVITDAQNHILSVNRAFTTVTGYEEHEVVGQNPRILKSGRHDGKFFSGLWGAIQKEGHWQGEVWNRRKNGDIFPVWLSVNTVLDTSTVSSYIGIMSDLSESKSAQAHIDYLSNYDTLTQLPNKDLLQDRTRLALANANRNKTNCAMLCIDLDRFQNINDSLGLAVGDEVLKSLATRLSGALQPDDTVCRPGGDEFIVLLPETNGDGAAKVASRLLDVIKDPVLLDEQQELRLTASIGIAVYPYDGSDFDKLSQSADAALKQAKQAGRNNFKFFTEQMLETAYEVLLIENRLRQALPKNELVLYYQPQVDARSGKIIGAEALIRWQHPEWGLVLPSRFIPIAENSGQILEIGEWVIDAAARQLAAWLSDGLAAVPVAVNLSAHQFHQPDLCAVIKAVLDRYDLPATMLELELTERIAMEDSSFTVDQINHLHKMGLKLSIDDFGTGYSSLNYLKRYKIDKLKIDQSFVHELGQESNDGAIVRAIISVAHDLGFKAVAEGVETRQQLNYLRAEGCDEIQGYLYSRPVPAEQFADLLRNGLKL